MTDLHGEKPSVFSETQAANQFFGAERFVGVFLVSNLIIYVLPGISNWIERQKPLVKSSVRELSRVKANSERFIGNSSEGGVAFP